MKSKGACAEGGTGKLLPLVRFRRLWNLIRWAIGIGTAFSDIQHFVGRERERDCLYVCVARVMIVPVVLYGSQTWSLTLREEYRLRVLGGIFGSKRDEVTGEWRKLHNEKLNDVKCSPNIVREIKLRRMRWAGHVARMEARRDLYRVLVENPEGRRPLGRPRRRWEDNKKINI
jgi:hypothetical protein